jgi:hypothetical protein
MDGELGFSTRPRWLGAGAIVAAALLLPGGVQAANGHETVRAVIRANYTVTFVPQSASRGAVVFVVSNRAATPQQFSVDGLDSPLIPPGGRRDLAVRFKRAGSYSYTLPDYEENVEGYRAVGGTISVS